ncbi:hypothetical protein BOX15_Mlig021224g3 [Macrostomum lignano]|uniref:Uncharacterized protein n=1 Tax=Macrostomum lignano TaxID=282301 RepID=A0A267G475_9PLAT|nr:hypothetical protein BOX15_Mlig021224g3 [Macrostomum lignano]
MQAPGFSRTAAVSAAASTDLVSTAEQPTGTSVEAAFQQQPKSASAAPQQPPQLALSASSSSACRQANWLVGVEPQDIRFPVNIAQVAFTATYFAALTSDRRKVYVNRRQPGAAGNCKRRAIDFPAADRRPVSLVSFDHRDVLCVVLRSRVEFHCLASGTRVGAYETPTAEVVAAASRHGRSPLGALWCSFGGSGSSSRKSASSEAAFTVWTDRTDAPKRALLLGQSVAGRAERFLRFHWTSEDAVLLVSRLAGSGSSQRQQQQAEPQPLIFSAFDTAGRRPMQRLCRRSVHSARQFCLSPDGSLLLLSGGSRHQLLEAATLRPLLTLPRRQSSPLPIAVTNAGDLLLLRPQPPACLEIHRRGVGLGPPKSFELAGLLLGGGGGVGGTASGEFRLYAIGDFAALLVFERGARATGADDATAGTGGGGGGDCVDGRRTSNSELPHSQSKQQQQQQQQQQQSLCLVALVDLNGNLLMRAEWPRARVQLVSDDLLVYLRRMSLRPFSAAHACIFDFNAPLVRRSCWAAGGDSLNPPAAVAASSSGGGKHEAKSGAARNATALDANGTAIVLAPNLPTSE